MKNLEIASMEALEGGKCIPGPGNSGDNSPITCTGLCLASYLSFVNSDGNSGVDLILC